jgi:5-methylcytosine-specific restriction endonuclease McrA
LNNPRITAKERNLIKGALRRVFARSELRNLVIKATIQKDYSDPERPRVKTWCKCENCKNYEPKSYMVVDHKEPVIPIHLTLEDMSWDTVIDGLWCIIENLQALCKKCHDVKTKQENKERRQRKKEKKK